MSRRRRLAALSVLFCVGLASSRASAEDAGDVAAARQLGIEGVKLAEAGKCGDAIDRLSRAEKLFHAPTTLGRLGECQVALGKLVEGTENLRRVVREQLAPGAPAAFVAAQDRARGVLDKATPRIGRLRIVVTGAADASVTVKIDDQPISSALLGVDRPSDPGEHLIEATAPGFFAARSKVTLKDGGSEVVTLALSADPSAVVKPADPANGKPADSGPHDDTKVVPAPRPSVERNYVPAFVSLAVGGAGVAVGAIFGGLALGARSSLVDACSGGRSCPASAQPTYDRATAFATVSTVGFIAGGVGLAAAVVLFFVAPTKTVQSGKLVPFVGPGAVGLGGRF